MSSKPAFLRVYELPWFPAKQPGGWGWSRVRERERASLYWFSWLAGEQTGLDLFSPSVDLKHENIEQFGGFGVDLAETNERLAAMEFQFDFAP